MGVLDAEIRGISEVQRVKNQGGESEGQKIKFLRLDNKDGHTISKFKEYLTSECIEHH